MGGFDGPDHGRGDGPWMAQDATSRRCGADGASHTEFAAHGGVDRRLLPHTSAGWRVDPDAVARLAALWPVGQDYLHLRPGGGSPEPQRDERRVAGLRGRAA